MKITFEQDTFHLVMDDIRKFIADAVGWGPPRESADPTDLPEPEPTKRGRSATASEPTTAPSIRRRGSSTTASPTGDEKPEPTKRRRSIAASTETKAKPTSRRRKSASAPSSTEAPAPKSARGHRKTASAASPSDVADKDLVKAASTLAAATNPKIVMDLLEEFGVVKVHELEGDARREFLVSARELADDA